MVCAPVRIDHFFFKMVLEIIDRTGAQAVLYFTCAMLSSVDLAHTERNN